MLPTFWPYELPNMSNMNATMTKVHPMETFVATLAMRAHPWATLPPFCGFELLTPETSRTSLRPAYAKQILTTMQLSAPMARMKVSKKRGVKASIRRMMMTIKTVSVDQHATSRSIFLAFGFDSCSDAWTTSSQAKLKTRAEQAASPRAMENPSLPVWCHQQRMGSWP